MNSIETSLDFFPKLNGCSAESNQADHCDHFAARRTHAEQAH
ncbi:hypothetical protein [Meridianimarinicoccus aquatilis]|nr:hypothetical protein [Fluviibacterium aquatile]